VQRLDVKAASFGQAEIQYKQLFADLSKALSRRKAKYVNGRPPPRRKGADAEKKESADLQEFRLYFDEKYRFILETQEKMKYFPPRKMVLKWTKEGRLTGAAPRKMRRAKFPDGTFGNWEKAPEGDEGLKDTPEWEYEKEETGDDGGWGDAVGDMGDALSPMGDVAGAGAGMSFVGVGNGANVAGVGLGDFGDCV
jgi:hypothetical protein